MDKTTISVEILGHDFKISFPAGHESDLREAADYLNRQMLEIKSKSKATNLEKITVLAALNITHELLASVKNNGRQEQKIKQLTEQLEQVLADKSDLI
ncbi:cell division protein ZapA [Marinomonas agarivorans]|nr:cell division protein ZapA [Marinomonas agarivorans]